MPLKRLTTMSDSFYSLEDVARILQISVATVRKLVANGDIPAIRIGKQWRVTREAFEAYVAKQGKSS